MKKHGFLSPNLPALIANIRKNGACQFAVAEAFNELAMYVLRDIHVDPASRQEVLAASLFGRVLTSFQSAIILCERGLLSDAGTLIRSAAETAIVLTAVVKDGEFNQTSTFKTMPHERAVAQSRLSAPLGNTALTKADIDTLKNQVHEIEENYVVVKNLQDTPTKLGIQEGPYGLPPYDDVGRIAVGNAAHGGEGFKFGPEEEDLPATLSDALSVMSSALTSIYLHFPEVEHQGDFEKCVAAWRSLSI